jgi:hypothetical protein
MRSLLSVRDRLPAEFCAAVQREIQALSDERADTRKRALKLLIRVLTLSDEKFRPISSITIESGVFSISAYC